MGKKHQDEYLNQSSFNNLFLLNKTEKKKVYHMVQKKKLAYLLFYTDYRNLKNIFQHGICQLKKLNLETNEVYYVWSYLQHDESIDLEFDHSSRAYFWKWAADSGLNPANMCVIGLDPITLIEQTVNDWFYDSSLKLISVHETVPAQSIEWVMVRKPGAVAKIEQLAAKQGLKVKIYYGTGSEIKQTQKKVAGPENG